MTEQNNECPQPVRVSCERRLTRIETKVDQHGGLLACILEKIDNLRQSNGCQTRDIAVLKTKAVMYGAIGACIVSPFAVGAALLLFKKVLDA